MENMSTVERVEFLIPKVQKLLRTKFGLEKTRNGSGGGFFQGPYWDKGGGWWEVRIDERLRGRYFPTAGGEVGAVAVAKHRCTGQ